MAGCLTPLAAWHPKPGATDRRPVFNPQKGDGNRPLALPCGQCKNCRLRVAQDWQVRVMCEQAEQAERERPSWSLTATFDNDHLSADGSLHAEPLQLFMKRLRHHSGPLRSFSVGEYGGLYGRPHWHIAAFGLDLPDLVPSGTSKSGFTLYQSPTLTKIWGQGRIEVNALDPENAAYIARYNMKKVHGDQADEHYFQPHPLTGEYFLRKREMVLASLRPAIGVPWFIKYSAEVIARGRVRIKHRDYPVPRIFLKLMSEADRNAVNAMKIAHGDRIRAADQAHFEKVHGPALANAGHQWSRSYHLSQNAEHHAKQLRRRFDEET